MELTPDGTSWISLRALSLIVHGLDYRHVHGLLHSYNVLIFVCIKSAVMVAVLRQKMNYSGALVITGRVVDVKHKCKEVGVYKQTN